MAIEENKKEYKTHKHKYTTYVNLNTKTKMGKDLLEQYHQQSKRHYMDVGRIGYHDEYGRYILDDYTRKELMVVPKIIIRVTKKAMDRVGKDVYQLRTYMSKFGQLNFLLLVDKDKAELILVENIYVENVNHKEDYETLIWKLTYHNQKPVPLAEIFYKFGIKANPDEYAKAWKDTDVKINHLVVNIAKATMTIQLANKFASSVNQKTLLASLNYLNKEGDYGKKITKAYSEKIKHKKEINELATSKKLENTLNHVLIKTLEDKTTKKDLKKEENFKVYKKVLDLQMTSSQYLAEQVTAYNTQDSLKKFLEATYQKPKQFDVPKKDNLLEEYTKKQADFEQIIEYSYNKKVNKEETEVKEEKIDLKNVKHKVLISSTFSNFEGEKIEIDINFNRFYAQEDKHKKRQREKEELDLKKEKKKHDKIKAKLKKGIKQFNAECLLDEELELSKSIIGVEPNKQKSKHEKINEYLNKKSNKKLSKKDKIKLKEEKEKSEQEQEVLVKRIERKIKNNNTKKEKKITKKQTKRVAKQNRKAEKDLKKDKKKLFKEYGFKEKTDKKLKSSLKDKIAVKNAKKEEKKKVDTALMEGRKTEEKKKKVDTALMVKNKKEDKKVIKVSVKQKDVNEKTNQPFRPVVKEEKRDFYNQPKVKQEIKPVQQSTIQQLNSKMANEEIVHKKSSMQNMPFNVKTATKEQEHKFVSESASDMSKFNKTHFDIAQNKRVVKKDNGRSMEM